VPELTYGLYAQISATRGAIVDRVPMRDLEIDLEAVAADCSASRCSNRLDLRSEQPDGAALDTAEWAEFLAALPDRCVAVVDEAYGDFVAPERRARREVDVLEGRRVIVLRSFSKLYGLAGLRLGYALVDEPLVAYLDLLEEPYNVNCAALAAGCACLRARAAVEERRELVAAARVQLADELRSVGFEPLPSQTNFVLARVDVDDVVLGDRLAERGLLIPPWLRLRAVRLRSRHGRPARAHGATRDRAPRRLLVPALRCRVRRVLADPSFRRQQVRATSTASTSSSRRRRRPDGRGAGRRRRLLSFEPVTAERPLGPAGPSRRRDAQRRVRPHRCRGGDRARSVGVQRPGLLRRGDGGPHTIALLLALARGVVELDRSVRDGGWDHQGRRTARASRRRSSRHRRIRPDRPLPCAGRALALGMVVAAFDPLLEPMSSPRQVRGRPRWRSCSARPRGHGSRPSHT
jgi:hypothetical protein